LVGQEYSASYTPHPRDIASTFSTAKMARLQSLGDIVLGRVSESFTDRKLLKALVDPNQLAEFWKFAK
jgi:hypothetical protein